MVSYDVQRLVSEELFIEFVGSFVLEGRLALCLKMLPVPHEVIHRRADTQGRLAHVIVHLAGRHSHPLPLQAAQTCIAQAWILSNHRQEHSIVMHDLLIEAGIIDLPVLWMSHAEIEHHLLLTLFRIEVAAVEQPLVLSQLLRRLLVMIGHSISTTHVLTALDLVR